MSGLRERLHQRAQPFAIRDLQVLTSPLGDRAGVVGAARLVIEEVFSAEAVDGRLAGQHPVSARPMVAASGGGVS